MEANQQNPDIEMSTGNNAIQPTIEELQSILDSNEPLEIEVQENGSIRAVSLGTAVKREVKKMDLQEALNTAEAHAARINAPSEPPALPEENED